MLLKQLSKYYSNVIFQQDTPAVVVWGNQPNDDNDIVYGYAIHESALYYAFSKEAKISASYRHAYLSTLVTVESVYGGVAINTDNAGDRRIVALVDYE